MSDETGSLLDQLGLRHVGAGPSGQDAYYATTFVLDADRKIVFRHVATDVRDRLSPTALIDAATAHLGAESGTPRPSRDVR